MEAILVLITAAGPEEARRLAEVLLDRRLVACVSRTSVVSDFWWQGAREQAGEELLIAKTRRELWPEVLEAIRGAHSYDVFEALAVPIVEGNPDYLQWISETTTPNPAG